MDGNRRACLEAFREVITFHDTGNRVHGSEFDHATRTEGIAPFRVVADFCLFRVEHHACLLEVSHGVFFNLFTGQRWAGGIASTGITDE